VISEHNGPGGSTLDASTDTSVVDASLLVGATDSLGWSVGAVITSDVGRVVTAEIDDDVEHAARANTTIDAAR
jgi:hypothetical protein